MSVFIGGPVVVACFAAGYAYSTMMPPPAEPSAPMHAATVVAHVAECVPDPAQNSAASLREASKGGDKIVASAQPAEPRADDHIVEVPGSGVAAAGVAPTAPEALHAAALPPRTVDLEAQLEQPDATLPPVVALKPLPTAQERAFSPIEKRAAAAQAQHAAYRRKYVSRRPKKQDTTLLGWLFNY